MQNIFDSHAHYDDPRFDGDRDALLCSMAEHGVRAIMNVGNTTGANLEGREILPGSQEKFAEVEAQYNRIVTAIQGLA